MEAGKRIVILINEYGNEVMQSYFTDSVSADDMERVIIKNMLSTCKDQASFTHFVLVFSAVESDHNRRNGEHS